MEIRRPDPEPRDSGDYRLYVNGIAYGKPFAVIYLSEDETLALKNVTLDDALRLARAAAQVAAELAATHARIAAPHGSDHFYQGRCQLCGKPEDDAIHAEPEPLKISDETIAAARAVADDIEAGTWPPADDDESGEDATVAIAESSEAEPEYPAAGSAIPPESNGGQPGYRVGECGHRVAGSEWRAGFRRCEHCGPDLGDDEREYCPECGADEDAGEEHADKCAIGAETAASVTR